MNMETVIAPSPLKMTDFMVEAISDPTSSDKFDVARKIASLAILLIDKEIDPRDAAISSDNALFQKTKEYQVGEGKISEEDAIDEVSDRKAVVLVSIIEKVAIKTCGAIGGAIGALIGRGNPKVIETGKCLGEALGRRIVRHKPVRDSIRKGVRKINTICKCAAKKVGECTISFLKKAVALG